MKNINLSILVSVAILGSACGPLQSSPAKDYKETRANAQKTTYAESLETQARNKAELKKRAEDLEANRQAEIEIQQTAERQKEAQIAEQNRRITVSKGLIDLRTEGSLNFIENKTSEFFVTARVLQLKMNYELVFAGLPQGATVETVNAQTKRVKWSPAAGFVESGKQSKSVAFDVELIPASPLSAADQRLLKLETTKETFEIVVAKSKENPVVQKVSGLDGVVQEGTKIKFVVEVRDPGAQGSIAPKVSIQADAASSRETVGVDGSAFISVDPDQSAPTTSAPGIWNFHFVYDTASKAAPRPSSLGAGNKRLAADEIPVRFKIEILSPSERSTTTAKEFRLRYNSQLHAPQFSLAEGSKLTVEIGKPAEIYINVKSPIASGKLVVYAISAQKNLNLTLPGGSKANKLSCTDDGSAVVTCRLGWKVPCDEALVGSTHKLSIAAKNSVGAIVVTGTTEQIITVTKSNETNCSAATPTAGGN